MKYISIALTALMGVACLYSWFLLILETKWIDLIMRMRKIPSFFLGLGCLLMCLSHLLNVLGFIDACILNGLLYYVGCCFVVSSVYISVRYEYIVYIYNSYLSLSIIIYFCS